MNIVRVSQEFLFSLVKVAKRAWCNLRRVNIFASYWWNNIRRNMENLRIGKEGKLVLAIRYVTERRESRNPEKKVMNNKLTAKERRHLARVKELSCGVCDRSGPSDAHHIEQGMQYTCIPLCADCHRGHFNGIHGQRRIWSVMKKTELTVLNDTIRKLMERSNHERPA